MPGKGHLNYLKDFTDLFFFNKFNMNCKFRERTFWYDPWCNINQKPKCSHHKNVFTTGQIDCHKLILSCLRANFKLLPPKKIFYRDHKSFNKDNFNWEVDKK